MNILIQTLKKLVISLQKYMNPNEPVVYKWDNPADARLSVRELADSMGMSLTPTFNVDGKLYLPKDVLCGCIEVESGFNPLAIHQNKDITGKVWSTDYGICQINDYWNIGQGKPFQTSEFVLDNPEASVRYMITQFMAGNERLWASYTSGLFKKYLPK